MASTSQDHSIERSAPSEIADGALRLVIVGGAAMVHTVTNGRPMCLARSSFSGSRAK